MDRVFLLQHENLDTEDVKVLGVYTSRDAADAAITRFRLQPGFRDYPQEFTIDDLELNKDHWVEGFEYL